MIIENFGIDDDLNRVGVSIYGQPDKYYYSEEFMFEFTKWCGVKYIRLTKGWVQKKKFCKGVNVAIHDTFYTTKELLEKFKEIKNGVSE